MAGSEPPPPTARSKDFERGTEEFARVCTFSDGLFAIAMTLLIVGIGVPTLRHSGDEAELLNKLNDLSSHFASFFISFAVIGRYWMAHHQFFSMLRAVDSRLIAVNLVYLTFIAFLPFPTALLGIHFENPISVVTYAVNVAAISGLEVVLFRSAAHSGLMRRRMPEDVYRWGMLASLSPVLFFLASIPLAFVSTTLAVAVWLLGIPAGRVVDRWKPPQADDWFEGG